MKSGESQRRWRFSREFLMAAHSFSFFYTLFYISTRGNSGLCVFHGCFRLQDVKFRRPGLTKPDFVPAMAAGTRNSLDRGKPSARLRDKGAALFWERSFPGHGGIASCTYTKVADSQPFPAMTPPPPARFDCFNSAVPSPSRD
jgi:hypothetical protein